MSTKSQCAAIIATFKNRWFGGKQRDLLNMETLACSSAYGLCERWSAPAT